MNNLDKKADKIDPNQDLVEYLQELAGLDTNDEGEIFKVEIAVHPGYELVVMPIDGPAAYFKYNEDFTAMRVEPPKED